MSIIGKYKNTCIVDTVYALLLYVLMTKDEDIKHTIFFIGDAVPSTVDRALPNIIRISTDKNNYRTRAQLIKFKLLALYYRFFFILGTKVFAQDHLIFSPQLIGYNSYTLVEDCPGFYWPQNYESVFPLLQRPKSFKKKISRLVKYGVLFGQTWGRNKQCIDRWVTMGISLQSEHLRGVRYTKIPTIEELWITSTRYKKELICLMYETKLDWKEELRKYDTIIFTDPIGVDAQMSDQEVLDLYMPFIKKYGIEHIVLKPHPRDIVDWEKLLPNIKVFKTKAPMQVLSLMGINFQRAITIQSSAVSSMKRDTEIIYLGTDFNRKLVERYGHRQFMYEDKFDKVVYPYGKGE